MVVSAAMAVFFSVMPLSTVPVSAILARMPVPITP